MKTETCKLYSGVFWIDPYNFELYRFKVGAFFETQCTSTTAVTTTILKQLKYELQENGFNLVISVYVRFFDNITPIGQQFASFVYRNERQIEVQRDTVSKEKSSCGGSHDGVDSRPIVSDALCSGTDPSLVQLW